MILQVRIESRSALWADRDSFFMTAEVEAFEGDEPVFTKAWDRKVPRDMV